MTRYPPGLIGALEKLQADTTVVHSASRATAHLWIEQPTAQTEEEGRLSRWNRLARALTGPDGVGHGGERILAGVGWLVRCHPSGLLQSDLLPTEMRGRPLPNGQS